MLSRAINLSDLLFDDLVSLLADGDDLLASYAELGDGGKNLLRDGSRSLPFCEVVWVPQGIVYTLNSVSSLVQLLLHRRLSASF